MRPVVLAVFSFMLLVILVPSVPALATPNITFIPSEFSANSSLILIVDPGQVSEPVSIMWSCPECVFLRHGLPEEGMGSVPRVGDKWYCYFSNTDNASNCGPVPFTATTYSFSPYNFIVSSMDRYGEIRKRNITLNTGGVGLTINTSISGNTVEMTVWADTSVSGVYYTVYSADTVEPVPGMSGSLSYYIPIRGYTGNVTLEHEDYFIEFRANAVIGGDFGGELVKVPLKQPGVVLPDGVVEVKDIVIEPVILDIMINRNQEFEQSGFEITNLGNVTIRNLSVSVPGHLVDYLEVDLASDTLSPGGHIFFTVTLKNVQNAMWISTNVNLTSNNTFIKYMPVNITVSVINECIDVQPGCVIPTGELSINPMIWKGDFLTYGTESKIFTLTNLGNTTLSNFSYATILGNIIDSVAFPGSIIPGGVGAINVSVRSSSPGSYTGALTVETEAGDRVVLIGVNFYDDVSGDVSSLGDSMDALKNNMTTEQYNLLSTVISSVESYISNAETDLGYEDYAGAKENYDKAYAAFNTLEGALSAQVITVPPEPMDMSLVLMIAAVVIIAVVAWFLFKKLRARLGRRGAEEEEFEGEEEFEEEF